MHYSNTSVEWLILDECDKLFEDGMTVFKDQVTYIILSTILLMFVFIR